MTVGLRDAHKARTRRALREAALKLFAERGFEATTSEEVAARASVSVRTFFRYFPTKESVLFQGERAWSESFTDLFRDQPASLSDLEALCAALVALSSQLPRSRQSLLTYQCILSTSPTLRGREQDQQKESAAKVADAIAARRSLPRADEACHLLASLCVLMYRLSLDSWLAGPASVPLGEVVVKKFRMLAEQFTQADATRRRVATLPPRRRAVGPR
jgi:AcrR family transcriptional regulator